MLSGVRQGIQIRLAVADDIPGIQLAAAESWRVAYSGIFDPDFIEAFVGRAYSIESLRRVIHSTRSVFVVASVENDIIGFGHAGYGPRFAELYRIYLRPAWWGSGASDLLLQRIEEWLVDEGYGGYGCFVHRRNMVGRRFYDKHQFQPVPEYNEEDNIFLWKDLGSSPNRPPS